MIWLGEKRGLLSDWVTQQWVKITGRRVDLAKHPWLDGPIGDTHRIGTDFYTEYAKKSGLEVHRGPTHGLLADFSALSQNGADLSAVDASVKDFYERTSAYELDAWSEWNGLFQPFGRALAILFSRRLQQLNIPLSSLDSRKGMSSAVLQLRDPSSGQAIYTAWVRELHATGNVVYAGNYSIAHAPGYPAPCVKVVFPLPNGNVVVLMKPSLHEESSLLLRSSGEAFGDPGFYFVVHDRKGGAWARYVRSMRETIHVYPAEADTIRTDHTFWIWGRQFLRLHYRMRTKEDRAVPQPPEQTISRTL